MLLADGHADSLMWNRDLTVASGEGHVDFPRMRELFFAKEKWRLSGAGDFAGVFHLYKGGRELKGHFFSDVAGVNQYRFPKLSGELVWLPDRFEVTHAVSHLYGGTSRFSYRIAPLGQLQRQHLPGDPNHACPGGPDRCADLAAAGGGRTGRCPGADLRRPPGAARCGERCRA